VSAEWPHDSRHSVQRGENRFFVQVFKGIADRKSTAEEFSGRALLSGAQVATRFQISSSAEFQREAPTITKLPGTMLGRGRGLSADAAGRGPNSAVTT
jgi:hypothetical protein